MDFNSTRSLRKWRSRSGRSETKIAYRNQIVMEETLDRSLDRLFAPTAAPRPAVKGPEPPRPEAAGMPGELPSLAAQARAHYQRALQAQRDGNWALYGEEIRRLGEVLERMGRGSPPR